LFVEMNQPSSKPAKKAMVDIPSCWTKHLPRGSIILMKFSERVSEVPIISRRSGKKGVTGTTDGVILTLRRTCESDQGNIHTTQPEKLMLDDNHYV